MPVDFTGEGYPRALATLVCPLGWQVLANRFFDVAELLQQSEEDDIRVIGMETDKGFLYFTTEHNDPRVGQLVLETIRASTSTCTLCSKSGGPIRLLNWDRTDGEYGSTVMCSECLRSALDSGVTSHPEDFPIVEALGYKPHRHMDRPWTPDKDAIDDAMDGLNGDEPGSAPTCC